MLQSFRELFILNNLDGYYPFKMILGFPESWISLVHVGLGEGLCFSTVIMADPGNLQQIFQTMKFDNSIQVMYSAYIVTLACKNALDIRLAITCVFHGGRAKW